MVHSAPIPVTIGITFSSTLLTYPSPLLLDISQKRYNPDTLNEPEVIHPLFSLTNSPVTRSEIAEIFKLLQDKKTQDYCGIFINFIKNFSDQLVMPLQHIINISFETSVMPNQMKIAKVIPLFKSGDPLSMDNYRPISLFELLFKNLRKSCG